ncbi:MAG: undecaprenyl-diphosphate phosphatase [Proteobacteria bacterium]|nr:undecaprenyl-diphosphate phosphatase [Pseudomonadota bacterium]
MESNWLQWLILALVQGLTEFLPISSSAHLILVSKLAGWKDQGLIMDIAAHFGSLLAVLLYFRKDIHAILTGKDWRMFNYLLISSIPLAITGLFMAGWIELHLRSTLIIAVASIFFGVLLWLAQYKKTTNSTISQKQMIIMGFAQVLALIPGASRAGLTMTAGMAFGLSKSAAARFSFLMAIPAILMSAAYGVLKYYKTPETYDGTAVFVITLFSFVAAFFCIHWFLKIIEKINFIWFMWYRVLLAILIIWYLQ